MVATTSAVNAEDLARGPMAPDMTPGAQRAWVEDAAASFRRHGVVAIRDAMPKAVVDAVLEDFKTRHDVHMAPGQKKLYRRFQTDPLRAQVPVAIDGPVADPAFFAPPSALALVRELLGDDVVVGEMGVVITHPGAGPQEAHRDSQFLFGGVDIDAAMPPFAMNLLVPLIDVTAEAGTTEYWPGSHRILDEATATAAVPTRLALDAGSVTLHDMRVVHRGGAKAAGPVRPLVYISFHRKWHQETYGYEQKPQLLVSPSMLQRLPEAYRPLFSWALHLNSTNGLEQFAHRWIGRLRQRLLSLKRR
jgi:ectoine hydroxylase-related dioxygenase (phytanoyl-CoA dioxygenase family)